MSKYRNKQYEEEPFVYYEKPLSALVAIATVIFYLVTCALCSCRSTKTATTTSDSVRIEYRERKVFVPDTVLFPLPPQKEYIITPDSESRLENDYAESYAAVKGGMLHHSLSTKPQDIPVEVVKEIEYRDSIIYRNRNVEVVKVKEVNKLHWWQTTLCWLGVIFIIWLVIYTMRKIRNPL